MKTVVDFVLVTLMALLVSIIVMLFCSGCKPSVPSVKDYPANFPCYAYDKCKVLQAYGSKEDCKLELQKCFRYADYEKCEKEPDPKKCKDELGIRY